MSPKKRQQLERANVLPSSTQQIGEKLATKLQVNIFPVSDVSFVQSFFCQQIQATKKQKTENTCKAMDDLHTAFQHMPSPSKSGYLASEQDHHDETASLVGNVPSQFAVDPSTLEKYCAIPFIFSQI